MPKFQRFDPVIMFTGNVQKPMALLPSFLRPSTLDGITVCFYDLALGIVKNAKRFFIRDVA